MNLPPPFIRDFDGIPVAFQRKRVRRLTLTVRPPEGDVRVSIPWHVSDADAIAFVAARIPWMRARIDDLRRAPRPASLRYQTGENVFLFGSPIPLRVVETRTPAVPRLENGVLLLSVSPGAPESVRRAILHAWLRARLSEILAPLLERWTAAFGEAPVRWDIRSMKTRWGSCSAHKRHLRFNLQLAQVPPECIEYVVVHELAHLAVQNHSPAFWALVARHLPDWRARRAALNRRPL